MRKDYRICDLEAYINWMYFFHAWSLPSHSQEGIQLQQEAKEMLHQLQSHLTIKTTVEILSAYSDGDDIVVLKPMPCECGQSHSATEIRIPMLRQQTPNSDGFCLCLSDFIRPKSAIIQDKIGIFATSVCIDKREAFPADDYSQMLLQTISDRLAEAGAERLHEEVRKSIWGYAPDESLSPQELHQEKFQGIRPAIGYPCLPDISITRIIDEIVNFSSIGVTLTSSAMMHPHASVSGFMISLPRAQYFSIGKIDNQQLADYAARRRMPNDEIKKYIQCF